MNGSGSGPRKGIVDKSGADQRTATVTNHSQPSPTGGTGRSLNSGTATTQKREVTGHWIGKSPILPNKDMTEAQRGYLMNTNMNIQHSSMEQFNKRADAFAKALSEERKVLRETQSAMRDNSSSVFQQSSHMVHTQRGDFWARREQQRTLDPNSTEGQSYQQKVMNDLKIAKQDRRQALEGNKQYDDLMDLMVGGKQGPLTREQSEMGIEAAAAGHQVLRGQRDAESGGAYSATRQGQTGRKGHPTKSATGVDLSGDADSTQRDATGTSVFMGTSGSTSDVVRSHNAAVKNVQKSLGADSQFGVRGATESGTNDATTRLATNWMRAGAPAKNVAQKIDAHLNSGDQVRISKGPTDSTQTHTMSEIRDAVTKTRNVLKPKPPKT